MINDVAKRNLIILDTNIYYDHFYLTSNQFLTLRDSLEQLNLVWALPEIVLDEVAGKYKEKIGELHKNLSKLNKDIERLLGKEEIVTKEIKVDESYNAYISQLRELFERSYNMILLPYPLTAHKGIAERAIFKRKPFKECGDGYRDTLIWETILSVLPDDKYNNILFVTNNSKDFFGKDGKIHHELRKDLLDINVNPDRVIEFNSLYSLLTKYIVPNLTLLTDALEKVRNNQYILSHKELIEVVIDRFTMETIRASMPDSNSGECFVNYIESVSITEVEDVRRLDNDNIIIELQIKLEAEFEYYVDKCELYGRDYEELEYSINDFNWNEYVAQVYRITDLDFSALIAVDEEKHEAEVIEYELI